MQIDIVSDTICPWCFIGKRRLERAVEMSGRNDVYVAWRPFQLNPDMPEQGMLREDYLRAKFGAGDRPRQIYQAITETGRGEGIDFQFARMKRTPNTVNSHRLIHWSGKENLQDQIVESLFHAYFEEGRDIGDIEVLVDAASQAGLEAKKTREFLRSPELKQEVLAADLYARRLGINGVPCFIVNRKYAVSGAQPPAAFIEVFNLAAKDEETEGAQSTAAL